MLKSIIYGLFMLLFLCACDEFELPHLRINKNTQASDTSTAGINPDIKEQAAIKYVIRRGGHSSGSGMKTASTDTLHFRVMFDSSAVYQARDPQNQDDINKLYGLSDCGSFHQTNSARFGWRWYNDRLEILAYCYYNGSRKWSFIGEAALNVFHEGRIAFTDEAYVFRINGNSVEMPRACDGVRSGYLLYPYFGGDETAPHDVRVWIETL